MRSHRFPSPSATEFGALQDDDLAQTVWGIDSIPPAWTKSTLVDWIEARLSLECGIKHLCKGSPGPRGIKKKFRLDLRIGGETNLCHWIGGALAPIWTIREGGGEVEQVLLPASPNEFQYSSLGWLGIDQKRFLVQTTQEQYPDFTTPPDVSSQDFYAGLRPIFLNHAATCTNPPKVFISRADAAYRRVQNEEALWGKLRENGFHRVIAGQLTLSQQIAVFRDAELILAPHGAALTLLFCCRPGTRLFELMPGFEERTCFRDLAHKFSLPYGRIICATHQSQNKRRREADLIFPLKQHCHFFEFMKTNAAVKSTPSPSCASLSPAVRL